MTKQSNLIKLTSLTAFIIAPGMANAADCVNGATYNASGSCQVPSGVTSMTIQAWGAGSGSDGGMDASFGAGGGSLCEATVTVVPNQTLTVTVGAGGPGGMDGGMGMGGGMSAVTGSGIVGLAANGGSPPTSDFGGEGGTTEACTVTGGSAFRGGNGGYSDSSGGGGGASPTNAPSPPPSISSALPGGIDGEDGWGDVGGAGGVGEGNGGRGGDTGQAGESGYAPGGGAGGKGATDEDIDGADGAAGRVTLSFQASPVAVPTMGAASLIGLTGLLGGLVGWKRRRDRR